MEHGRPVPTGKPRFRLQPVHVQTADQVTVALALITSNLKLLNDMLFALMLHDPPLHQVEAEGDLPEKLLRQRRLVRGSSVSNMYLMPVECQQASSRPIRFTVVNCRYRLAVAVELKLHGVPLMTQRHPPVRSQWVCIGIETTMPWPTTEVRAEYQGHTFILLPENTDGLPTIGFDFGGAGIDQTEAMKLLRRFMTAVTWMQGHGMREKGWASASVPINARKPLNSTILTSGIDLSHLPAPTNPDHALALALYREALANNSVPYKFLGLTRIINMVAPRGKDQINWINANIAHVKNSEALSVISALKSKNIDVGDHLYVSGRCAVAHAGGSPVVNPDSSEDLSRMIDELPLIRALAELVIENEFGIKSRMTIWKEHLYELEGFKKVIPSMIIDEIAREVERIVLPEELNIILEVGLREEESFGSLARMYIQQASMGEGRMEMVLATEKGFAMIWLATDFKNERLVSDPYRGMGVNDDGSVDAAMDGKCFFQFRKGLFLNGRLQIKDARSGMILGYTSAFIPQNVDGSRTIANFDRAIAVFEARLDRPSGGCEGNTDRG